MLLVVDFHGDECQFICIIILIHVKIPNKVVISIDQYKEINSEFSGLSQFFSGHSRNNCESKSPLHKKLYLDLNKVLTKNRFEKPDEEYTLVKLITNCRLSKLSMIYISGLSKKRDNHIFTSPSSLGLNTDHVSPTTMNY